MKINKQKIAKYALRGGTAVGALLLGLVPAYLLTPARTNIIDLTVNNSGNTEATALSELINRYKGALDDGIGLHMEFEDFTVSFPGQNNRNNLISIKSDSEIEFIMRNLDDIDLKADLTVDYNHREVPVALAYIDETVYLRLYDLGLKMGSADRDSFLELMDDVYGQDLNIDVNGFFKDLGDKFVDGLKSIVASSSKEEDDNNAKAASSDETGMKFTVLPDVKLNDGGHLFKFEIANTVKLDDVEDDPLTENVDESLETTYMGIHITTKANYDITRIDLCPDGKATDANGVEHDYFDGLKFGDIEIKGALNVDIKALNITAPHETESFRYVEIVNYYGWLRRLGNLLADNNRKMSFDFAARLTTTKEVVNELTEETEEVPAQLGGVKGAINLDASNLINLEPLTVGYVDNGQNTGLEDGHLVIENEKVRKILNAVKLGLDFQLYDANDDWDSATGSSNLSLKYANESAYMTLNEFPNGNNDGTNSVLKAKVDTNTINWMIKKLPTAIDDISREVKEIIQRFTNRTDIGDDDSGVTAESFFDFLTDSDLVVAVKEGEYAPILDLITRISNNATVGVINMDLSLKPLGFGNDSTVSLTLDARDGDDITVMSLTAQNIQIHSVTLDFDLHSVAGREIVIGEESSYDSMSFLPTVVDQVTGILGDKQVAFDLDATIYDEDNLGTRIYGDAQFDYGSDANAPYSDKGFGQMTIEQYKYHARGSLDSNNNAYAPWATHQVSIDVDNHSNEPSGNKVKFIYGDPTNDDDNIKGYFTMQTIYDIVKMVKVLLKDTDERYTKFTDMFAGAMVSGSISDIISDKNYLRLAQNDFIKEIKQYDNGHTLNVVIGKTLLGLGSDIQVKIHFKDVEAEYGDRELESIELVNFAMGEKESVNYINAKLTLKEFDLDYASPISSSDEGYYDLTSIKQLLDFGINTTKIDYYHLTGNINLNTLGFVNVDLEINVYIHVNGHSVELYGKISYGVNKLVVWGATAFADAFLHGNLINVDTEFTFHTFADDDPLKDNDVGGYFDIYKDVTSRFIVKWHDKYHYRTTAKNLLDDDNIMTYLMDDLLDINGSAIGSLATGSDDEEKTPGQYTKMFTNTFDEDSYTYFGYGYDENAKSWHIGLNMQALLGIEAIEYLDLGITTQEATIRGETMTCLHEININQFIIKASILTIKISGSLTLTDVNTSWSSAILSRYNAITSVSNAAFGSKLNNPNAAIES